MWCLSRNEETRRRHKVGRTLSKNVDRLEELLKERNLSDALFILSGQTKVYITGEDYTEWLQSEIDWYRYLMVVVIPTGGPALVAGGLWVTSFWLHISIVFIAAIVGGVLVGVLENSLKRHIERLQGLKK